MGCSLRSISTLFKIIPACFCVRETMTISEFGYKTPLASANKAINHDFADALEAIVTNASEILIKYNHII